MKTKEYFQSFVDAEFDKFLPIKIGGREYHIAISKDRIPSIQDVKIDDEIITIDFSDVPNHIGRGLNEDVNVQKDTDGKIIRVVFPKLELLDNGKSKGKISRMLNKEITLKERVNENKDFVIKKNIRKRLYLALNNIVQTADREKVF